MILHLYFARRFAASFGVTLAVLFAMIFLVDLVDQTRRFADRGANFGGILELTLLNAPETTNLVLPLIVLLATVWGFVRLVRSSELIATRAAGRSGPVALAAPAAVALLIGVLAVTVFNPIVAGTSKKYTELAQSFRSGGASTLSISNEGLWLRQGSPEGQMVIRAKRTTPDANVLFDVTLLAYDPEGGPNRRIYADSAEVRDGEWYLRNAKDWPLVEGTNAEANSKSSSSLTIPSTLTVERIRESFGRPSTISIWDLPKYIRRLDQAGFSSLQHRVWFHAELARPLFLVAMVLVASAFTMRQTRMRGTGIGVLTAVLLGFVLYFIRSFALILGENGQLPVLMAAWAPPLASVLLALGPLLHTEEG